MKITFLTIGKNGDRDIEGLVDRYIKRLTHYTRFETRALPDVKTSKNDTIDRQKTLEGASILSVLKPSDHVILLDERGRQPSSAEFASMLDGMQIRGVRDVVFVVGGPYGFSKDVYDRADGLLSLSRMTLTHEMVRLFFVEQVYRAFTIIRGENYHHE